MMKGINLVRTKEHDCKEKVVFDEIEDTTSRMVDQANTRETAEPTLSAKVIAQEIMASSDQEYFGMSWTFGAIIIYYILDTNFIYLKCLYVCYLLTIV